MKYTVKHILRKLIDCKITNILLFYIFILTKGKSANKTLNIVQYYQKFSHIYFGYYDISPFSANDKYLLAQCTKKKNTPPDNDYLTVGYFNIDESENFIELGKTNTWNWQQGCRLQWYPKNDSTKIFYNKMFNHRYGGIIQDINSKKIVKQYDFPVYDINFDGTYGLSLNFSRLGMLRPGYGYKSEVNDIICKKEPEDDGVIVCDLKSGKKKLLFSIRKISNVQRLESMNGAYHYFNHLSFNPAGDRFLFLHLWDINHKRYARLITSNMNGSDIHILNNSGHTSHYTWKDNEHILSFSTDDYGEHYYIYNDITGKKDIFANGIIEHDSHPSFSNDKERLLYDSYPSRLNVQNIYIFSEIYQKIIKLASFYNAYGYRGEVRCDLHPRWNSKSTMICCDSSNMEGYRSMFILKGRNVTEFPD